MNEDSSAAPEPELKGIDLARRALEEARATAKANGKAGGQGPTAPKTGSRTAPMRLQVGGQEGAGVSRSAGGQCCLVGTR